MKTIKDLLNRLENENNLMYYLAKDWLDNIRLVSAFHGHLVGMIWTFQCVGYITPSERDLLLEDLSIIAFHG